MGKNRIGGGPIPWRRVRLRTFLLVLVPLALPILFSVVFVPFRQERALTQAATARAEVLVRIFAANAAAPIDFDDREGLSALLETARPDPDLVFLAGYAEDGTLLASTGALPQTPRVRAAGLTSLEEDGLLHVTAPVVRDGARLGAIEAAFSTAGIRRASTAFRWTAAAFSLVVLALAALIAFVLGRGFSRLVDQLRASLLETARKVDEVVKRLAHVAAEQTSAASEESAALQNSNATAAEVGQAANAAAQRATALIVGGGRAEDGASSGLQAVGSATEAMRQVREQMYTLGVTVSALSERAAAIGEIASTVALLAERSNLLALNASIEAARAGAQGRGFSVVAQEMRSLADGSNRSAAQVKTIIGEIQSAIARAVSDALEGERRVRTAEDAADRAGESIRKFVEATREFAQVGREIANASNAQSVAIVQLVDSIHHAAQAGTTQLETTRQVEETTRLLRQTSDELLASLAGAVPAFPDGKAA